MQIGAIRALAALALAGLVGGCAPVGALGPTDGAGAQTVTGCGGEVLTVPAGEAVPSPACSHGPMTPPGPGQALLDGGDPLARAWVVTLQGADGRALDLRVAPDGRVVGYQVEGTPLQLALPRYSRDGAIAIAVAKVRALDGRTDVELTSAEFSGTLSAAGEGLAWTVGAGVPQPHPSYGTAWAFGGAVEVDAVSGEVTVRKH